MSSRTPASSPTPVRTKFKVDKGRTLPPAAQARVDFASLEIVDDAEGSFDPYNSTGQHCLEAMKRADALKEES